MSSPSMTADGFGTPDVDINPADGFGTPDVDIMDCLKSHVYKLDVPGIKADDITVQLDDGNVLLISGERKIQESKEGHKYLRKDRKICKFMQKFVLPENANTDAIKAVYCHGVLTVKVKKLLPKVPRIIEVVKMDPGDPRFTCFITSLVVQDD